MEDQSHLRYFEGARKKLVAAAIHLDSYYYPMHGDMSDAEIVRDFEMAKALGVPRITVSSVLPMIARIDVHARQANVRV